MIKKLLLSLTLIALIAIIALIVILKNGVSITITEAEIQSAVNKKFPLDMTHFVFLRVEYTDPIIELIDNKERVRMGITVSPFVEVNGKRHSGSAIVNGGFRYEPGSGRIFLTGFTVEKLQLDGYKSIKLDKLSGAISDMLENVYSKYPVYTLGDDVKQSAAKMFVRKVSIRNKAVTILLGP